MKSMEIEPNKLYSFKVKNRKEREQGIVIAEGKEWILVKYVFFRLYCRWFYAF